MKKLLAIIFWLLLMRWIVNNYYYIGLDYLIPVFIFMFVFPIVAGIEAVALYNIFDIFKDKDGTHAFLASILINLITFTLYLILAPALPRILVAPLLVNYTVVPITTAGIVLFNVFIELVVLKIIFNPDFSVTRVLAFILVNTLTIIMVLHGFLLLNM